MIWALWRNPAGSSHLQSYVQSVYTVVIKWHGQDMVLFTVAFLSAWSSLPILL